MIVISSSGPRSSNRDCVCSAPTRLSANVKLRSKTAKYTGEILFYAYGQGKADAIRLLAADEDTTSRRELRVPDSMTDLPMLEAVGNQSPRIRTKSCAPWPRIEYGRFSTSASPLRWHPRKHMPETGLRVLPSAAPWRSVWLGTHVTGSATSPDRASRDCASLARNTCRQERAAFLRASARNAAR